MANSRNKVDNLLNISGPKVPRYIHKSETVPHLTSIRHGDLGICACIPVLANETVSFDANVFARADTSARVPLDDIFTDIYYFYVPYRFLDEDFAKVLGDKHPLDTNEYFFPQIYIDDIAGTIDASCLLFDLGWSFVQPPVPEEGSEDDPVMWNDSINAYYLMAYWKIYNDFFRDENLDPYVDIEQLKELTISYGALPEVDLDTIPNSVNLSRLMFAAQANRLTDIYSRSLISPQYGDAHLIPAAQLAAVTTSSTQHHTTGGYILNMQYTNGTKPATDVNMSVDSSGRVHGSSEFDGETTTNWLYPTNLYAELQKNMGTIQELSIAMSLQAMDFARATHGHRYIETLEALWGSSMPDYLVGRAEYLGGTTTNLNNIPVLSTEAAYLGSMAGNSASLFNDGGFTKTFPEPGVVLGVYTNRVYHKSAQGKAHYLNYQTLIDLPNIYVADFGPMPLMQSEIANIGDGENGNSEVVFSFSKSWIHERTIEACVGGIFNPNTSGAANIDWDEFRQLWSYIDYYAVDDDLDGLPTFNAEWLKEPAVNVARTMTGRLIPGAPVTGSSSHMPQYMFGFYQHCKRTNFLPPDPDPLWYVRRL